MMGEEWTPEEEAALDEAMFEAVRLGYLEVVGTDEQGRTHFRITKAGEARVEQLIEEGG